MEDDAKYLLRTEFQRFELENQRQHHLASERQTRVEGSLSHVPSQLDTLTNSVADLAKEVRARPQPSTGTDMVVFNAIEAAKQMGLVPARPATGSAPAWALSGACVAIAVMAILWKVLG